MQLVCPITMIPQETPTESSVSMDPRYYTSSGLDFLKETSQN